MRYPILIVKVIAEDSEGTFHCMLCWQYESGKLEHVTNLTVEKLSKASGYSAELSRNVFTGGARDCAYIPNSVFCHLNICDVRADWMLIKLQSMIGELFGTWENELKGNLKKGVNATLDLTQEGHTK